MKGIAGLALSSVLTVGVMAACSSDTQSDEHAPSAVRKVDCPDDVEAAVLAQHSCAEVALSADRHVFVLRVEPPEPSDANPVVVLGTDLGKGADSGGLAPIAQRTGRVALIADLPGTGHSSPLLDCPEVTALSGPAAADPAGARRGVVAAVSDCKQRLLAAGAHPDDVSVASAAADLHEVVGALGIPEVVALSTGTTGSVGIAWGQQHPEDLEALVLDSPLFTKPALEQRTDAIVASVAQDCAADAACTAAYADVEASWSSALQSLGARPIPGASGTTRVQVDDMLLRRAVLWLTGRGQGGAGLVPSLIAEAAAGTAGDLLGEYVSDLLRTPPYCAGYLPKCQFGPVSYGATLGYNCPQTADDPLWTDICAAWGRPAGDPFTDDVVEVPTLVLLGSYNGFTTTAETRAELADILPDAFYVVTRTGGHNVLGQDCIREIRTSWLQDDLTQPPADTACLGDQHLEFP